MGHVYLVYVDPILIFLRVYSVLRPYHKRVCIPPIHQATARVYYRLRLGTWGGRSRE